MFIGFDIGNTNTLLGIYKNKSVIPEKTFSYKTKKNTSSDNLAIQIKDIIENYRIETNQQILIDGFAFSSVVPELNQHYNDVAISFMNTKPHEISHKSKLGITIKYDNLEELGVDRIVNAEAVFNEYNGNAIIIDIGTAATFCVLLKDGTFDGGLIAPGIGTTIKALAARASKLPPITFEKIDKIIARDTVNAIKSGFFYGWISLVEGIIKKIRKEYNQEFKVILTGGASKIISDNIEDDNIFDPLLTMKGIKYIYDQNK